jgi:hypothetical protein
MMANEKHKQYASFVGQRQKKCLLLVTEISIHPNLKSDLYVNVSIFSPAAEQVQMPTFVAKMLSFHGIFPRSILSLTSLLLFQCEIFHIPRPPRSESDGDSRVSFDNCEVFPFFFECPAHGRTVWCLVGLYGSFPCCVPII